MQTYERLTIMPYIKIETNQPLDQSAVVRLIRNASAFMARVLDKPEQYIMVACTPAIPMILSANTQPAAYIELKSIGLQQARCPDLCREICGFIERELGVRSDRVYIEFTAINGAMFGWNGKTF